MQYHSWTNICLQAESTCQKILKPALEFSPTVQFWYDRAHTYILLIKIKSGEARKNISTSAVPCALHHLARKSRTRALSPSNNAKTALLPAGSARRNSVGLPPVYAVNLPRELYPCNWIRRYHQSTCNEGTYATRTEQQHLAMHQ